MQEAKEPFCHLVVNYFGQQLSLSFGRKKELTEKISWKESQSGGKTGKQEQAAKGRHWGLEGACLRRAKAQRQKGRLKNGSDEGSKDQ